MTEAQPFRASPWREIVATTSLALLVGGCTFDFEAPFAASGDGGGGASSGPTSPGSSTSTTSGEGGEGQGAGPTVTVSSSVTTTTTTTTSQSSGQPLEEDCGNGVDDDDDDDDVDCEDSTCQAGGYTCVLWNAIPGDWRDPDGWVERALTLCRSQPWSLMVLHDLPTGAMRHLDRFLTACAAESVSFRQEFPPDCVPILRGKASGPLDPYVAR
jgi:hypothetical protein